MLLSKSKDKKIIGKSSSKKNDSANTVIIISVKINNVNIE